MENKAIETLLEVGAERASMMTEALNIEGNELIALPKDYALHDLERYRLHRRRFRGSFSTSALADFITYVKRNAESTSGGRPQGFISADAPEASLFFNLREQNGVPGHGDWTAALSLDKTAAYAAMLSIEGRPLTQRQLTDWIEDWQPNIVALAGDDTPITLPRAVVAISKLDISGSKTSTHTDGHFAAAKSSMESVEAKLTDTMPQQFLFECEPYTGLSARTFHLRVSILTNHEDPRLVLRIIQKEAMQEDITREFKKLLLEELGSVADLTIGTFKP